MTEPEGSKRPRKYRRRRAACLAAVYLFMALHFAHWWITGRTVTPLEVSETMHTLEMGVLTAGFFLMAVALLSVAIAGRFFCSWGCHILALEDLSAWLLLKVGIRPKAVRSRLMLLVPPVAALYMFVWPQVLRVWEGRPAPKIAIWTDKEGWASFVTENYWRSMPGPFISALTLLVCGFAVIYFLGTRSFCTYACPYGAVFAFTEQFAPGRIVVAGDCTGCGKCTAACETNIRVHEELLEFGKVVNSSCLKAMDCVDACPTKSVVFGFARPAFFKAWRKQGRFGVPYDFTLAEDALILAFFVAGFAVFRGLYDSIPFLLTLALAGILGFLIVTAVRVTRLPNVRLIPFQLKLKGRLTLAGWAFQAIASVLLLLTAHSGFIRYHEARGRSMADELLARANVGATVRPAEIHEALAHLKACERFGLVRPVELNRRLASMYLLADDAGSAEPYMRRVVAAQPDAAEWRIRLAALLLTQNHVAEAISELRAVTGAGDAVSKVPPQLRASAHEMLAQIRMVQGDPAAAATELQAALLAWPASETARAALSDLLQTESAPATP